MGTGREQREDDLEERHRQILQEIEDTEMPDWVGDYYMNGPERYEKPLVKPEYSYSSIWLIVGSLGALIATISWLMWKYVF